MEKCKFTVLKAYLKGDRGYQVITRRRGFDTHTLIADKLTQETARDLAAGLNWVVDYFWRNVRRVAEKERL